MIGRARKIAWTLLIVAGVAGAISIIPTLESHRSLELLKQEGATFDIGEDGSVRWMTLSPDETTDETLRLLHDNPALVHLTLADCTITDEGLQNLGTLENLTRLDLSGTRRLTTDGLQHLRGCTSLSDLSLADCPWVSDETFAAVGEFRRLRILDLSSTSVSDTCVDRLLELDQLALIHLANCPNVTESGIRRLIELPNLERLNIAGTSMSIDFWEQLPTMRPELRIGAPVDRLPAFAPLIEAGGRFSSGSDMRRTISFSIEGPIAPDALAPLGELEWRLTGLSIANCPVEDADLHWLSRLPALESLGLSGTRVSDISLERVAQSPLRYVDLSGTAVTDQVFSHLAHVRTLEYLDLSETGIRGQGLAEFTDMPNLDYVNLSETLLDDDGAAHLARLPAVSSLNLADTAISDAGLASLGDAPALVNLVVDNTAIHGEGLAGLSRAATIRYLYLDCKQLNDESLRHLVDLPSLSSLKLGDCSIGDSGFGHLARIDGLVGLTISGTHLTPAIGPALERMANLRALSFRGEVSNEVLALLAEQRGLESLHLSRARYHEDAANALAAARPDLYVQR